MTSPLGFQRLRILHCLGGDQRFAPGFFLPDPGQSLYVAYREHIQRLSEQWWEGGDRASRALLAAGQLLTGELAWAEKVLDQLPEEPLALDHFAGTCLVVPFQSLLAALPLSLESPRWVAGSETDLSLRNWLRHHAQELVWDEVEGQFFNNLSA